MRIIFLIITLIYLFFGVSPVFAADPPILTSPANNSTVTSSTLNWQAPSYSLYSSSPYRIQVDDDQNFGSINKDYYTSNAHYSPSLIYGTWFWKVKAKDSGGTWSNWSDVWSFVFTDTTSTPTPSPTQKPTPTPTPTPNPTSSPNSNTFSISNTPTQVSSNQSFTALVNLSLSDKSNTNFYIKGAFKKSDGSNYFGLTKVNGNWVKNSSSFSNQLFITTNSSGNWSGNLEITAANEDPGYTGSGDYIFKVGRYDTNGNLTWSNEVTIHINNVESVQGSLSDNQASTSKIIINPSPTASPVLSKSSISQSKTSTNVASVAGASKMQTPSSTSAVTSSSSADIKVASQKQNNPFVFIGIIFIIGGIGSLGYIYLRKNEAVYKYFRKRN